MINRWWPGGLALSARAIEKVREFTRESLSDIPRDYKPLVEIVGELGALASAENADVVLIDIPDNSTDYLVYGGESGEELFFVLDGKIHQAW